MLLFLLHDIDTSPISFIWSLDTHTWSPMEYKVCSILLENTSSNLPISHLTHIHTHELCPHCPSPSPFPSTLSPSLFPSTLSLSLFPSTLSPTLDSYIQSSPPTSRLLFSMARDTSGLCFHTLDIKQTSLLPTVSTYKPPGLSISCLQTHTHNLPKKFVVLHCNTPDLRISPCHHEVCCWLQSHGLHPL